MPSKDAPALSATALEGLLERTDYPAIEVIVPDNGSTSPEALAVYDRFKARHANLTVSILPEPFNFAAAINRGVSLASGDVYLLVNNDVEIVDPLWLREMVSCLAYGDAGIVGAKLLYPSRLSQHLGVIVGFGDYAGHWFMEQPEDFPGPMGRLAVRQSLTAVTGACLLGADRPHGFRSLQDRLQRHRPVSARPPGRIQGGVDAFRHPDPPRIGVARQ
jgi:GT2 family glycosyltransferase